MPVVATTNEFVSVSLSLYSYKKHYSGVASSMSSDWVFIQLVYFSVSEFCFQCVCVKKHTLLMIIAV